MFRYNSVKCLWTFLFVGICSVLSFAQTQSIDDPEVTILQGSLRGIIWTTRNGRNISAFRGIPYAQPPIGNLRFANPVAADRWNGTRNASSGVSSCAQLSLGEEDCLYLDVYTPELPENTNSTLLPVMVFIPGGRFKRGNMSTELYNPRYLLDKDVLLVLLQYRLGPLGFLSTGDEVASGNWGLKDQILALKWVQSNIKYFGGNPDDVTLFGGSAGSASLHLLTLSDATRGLFHKYITQSGSALAPWAHQPRASYANRAFELGKYVGCLNDSSESLINCLRTVDVSEIIATESQFYVWYTFPTIVWVPTDEPDIEGAVITNSPTNLFAAGKIRDLPWISGIVRDEGLLNVVDFFEDETLLHDFLENFDLALPHMLSWSYQSDSGAAWTNAVKSYYFDNDLTGNTSELLSKLTLLVSDALFYHPAHSAMQQQFKFATKPQYLYTFNYKGTYEGNSSTGFYGIRHSGEMPYLFSRTSNVMNETDFKVVDAMVQLWTSFAINGTPTSDALNGVWNSFSLQENYLRIGNDSDVELEVQSPFFAERMQFWTNLEISTQNSTSASVSNANNFIPIITLLAFPLFCSQFVLP